MHTFIRIERSFQLRSVSSECVYEFLHQEIDKFRLNSVCHCSRYQWTDGNKRKICGWNIHYTTICSKRNHSMTNKNGESQFDSIFIFPLSIASCFKYINAYINTWIYHLNEYTFRLSSSLLFLQYTLGNCTIRRWKTSTLLFYYNRKFVESILYIWHHTKYCILSFFLQTRQNTIKINKITCFISSF